MPWQVRQGIGDGLRPEPAQARQSGSAGRPASVQEQARSRLCGSQSRHSTYPMARPCQDGAGGCHPRRSLTAWWHVIWPVLRSTNVSVVPAIHRLVCHQRPSRQIACAPAVGVPVARSVQSATIRRSIWSRSTRGVSGGGRSRPVR
ncbi:hypothetical protein ACQEVC_44630 [Plantactinospora sp. CA-294935]|uniref:hypothetical protein n=1 Tax=Plantactinospora sp. CA-294935 TaxID=3240012 RepID=UPI003D9247C7